MGDEFPLVPNPRPRITHVAEMDDADRRKVMTASEVLLRRELMGDEIEDAYNAWFDRMQREWFGDFDAMLDRAHRDARAKRLEAERIERQRAVRLLLWTNLIVWSGVALITYVELWR